MTFKELPVRAVFNFVRERQWTSLMQGPWIKLSAKKYAHIDGRGPYHVGTVNVLVEEV